MTHASLFSGIGGAEIAATWMGWTTLFHCEINPFGRKALEYWYPNSTSYEDITKTDFTPWRGRIDVLTAGFPCQPFSVAGQRKGADDDRYLWPQVVRVVREARPSWVVGENVAGILTMVQPGEEVTVGSGTYLFGEDNRKRVLLRQQYVIETVCRDLEREGYEVRTFVIPACAVGAPHRRDRVWIIAHRSDTRSESLQCGRKDGIHAAGAAANSDEHRSTPQTAGEVTERSRRSDLPQPEKWGNPSQRADGLHGLSRDAAHADSTRPQERLKAGGQPDATEIATGMDIGVERYGSGRIIADIRNKGLQGKRISTGHDEKKREESGRHAFQYTRDDRRTLPADRWKDFPTQSPVCGRNDGLPFHVDDLTIPFTKWRTESIKAYGNAWVPQVAYEIFRAIQQTEDEETTD